MNCYVLYSDIIIDSKILTDDEKHTLRHLLIDNGYKLNPEWKLLYRGSDEEFLAAKWNEKCTGKQNIISIILSENKCVFGGFTMNGWNKSLDTQYKADENAFLYQLRSTRVANFQASIFPVEQKNYSQATCCSNDSVKRFKRQ